LTVNNKTNKQAQNAQTRTQEDMITSIIIAIILSGHFWGKQGGEWV
jgi:hypothetical protein